MIKILQHIYDNEINFKIQTFWDGGFDVFLNGIPGSDWDYEENFRTIEECLVWLGEKVLEKFPNAEFNKEIEKELKDFKALRR